MALVEIFHVVANEFPLDTTSTPPDIKEGMLVAMNAGNGIRRVDATTGVLGVIGIAGDTKSTSASAMPGIYPGWQNRVSDSFDETRLVRKLPSIKAAEHSQPTSMLLVTLTQVRSVSTLSLTPQLER